MGKIGTYSIIFSGLITLYYFTGLIDASSSFLGLLLNPSSIQTASWTTVTLATLVAGGGIAAIAIAVWIKNIELSVMTVIVPLLAALMWDIIGVYNKIAQYNYVLATIFCAPFLFLFALALIDWWRGRTD
jgi:hypothetical protein